MFVSLKAVVKHIHAGAVLCAVALLWGHAQLESQWLNSLVGAVASIRPLQPHTQSLSAGSAFMSHSPGMR